MRKPTFCICENKDADLLCGNREADQRLCFRYTDSAIPLLSKSEISSLEPSCVAVQVSHNEAHICFHVTRLNLHPVAHDIVSSFRPVLYNVYQRQPSCIQIVSCPASELE